MGMSPNRSFINIGAVTNKITIYEKEIKWKRDYLHQSQ